MGLTKRQKRARRNKRSGIIKETVDKWKRTGKVGDARPRTKGAAVKMAVAIAMRKTTRTRRRKAKR